MKRSSWASAGIVLAISVAVSAKAPSLDLREVLHHPGAEYVVFVRRDQGTSSAIDLVAINPINGATTAYDLSGAEGWPFIVDGQDFFYSNEGDIWALNLSDATKRKIATGPFVLVDLLPESNGTRLAIGFTGDKQRCIAELSSAAPKVLISLQGGSGWPTFLSRHGDALIMGWRGDNIGPLFFHSVDLANKTLGEEGSGILEYDGLSINSGGLTIGCDNRRLSIPFQSYLVDVACYKDTLFIATVTYAWLSLGGKEIRLDSTDIANNDTKIVLSSAGVCMVDSQGKITLLRAEGPEPMYRVPESFLNYKKNSSPPH